MSNFFSSLDRFAATVADHIDTSAASLTEAPKGIVVDGEGNIVGTSRSERPELATQHNPAQDKNWMDRMSSAMAPKVSISKRYAEEQGLTWLDKIGNGVVDLATNPIVQVAAAVGVGYLGYRWVENNWPDDAVSTSSSADANTGNPWAAQQPQMTVVSNGTAVQGVRNNQGQVVLVPQLATIPDGYGYNVEVAAVPPELWNEMVGIVEQFHQIQAAQQQAQQRHWWQPWWAQPQVNPPLPQQQTAPQPLAPPPAGQASPFNGMSPQQLPFHPLYNPQGYRHGGRQQQVQPVQQAPVMPVQPQVVAPQVQVVPVAPVAVAQPQVVVPQVVQQPAPVTQVAPVQPVANMPVNPPMPQAAPVQQAANAQAQPTAPVGGATNFLNP